MTGEEFAVLLSQRIFDDQVKAGQIDPTDKKTRKKGYTIIPSNNEMSKSLDTAVITIYGQVIEIVNLRTEPFSPDSSVP